MPLSRVQIKNNARKFNCLVTINDLARLLRKDEYKIRLLTFNPAYEVFHMKKANGGKRLIEDPNASLKSVQSILNFYLQTVYYVIRPDCVYGFTISAKQDEEDRNIVSNAKKHLACSYLLKIDLLDFFHQVGQVEMGQIIKNNFPGFNEDLVDLIIGLVLYKGRLPMGAPTSPVLSNFSMLELDQMLMQYANSAGMIYTRYADDFTFSSRNPITNLDMEVIRDCIVKSGFVVNEHKVKIYEPDDVKEITGIIVKKNELGLPDDFLPKLEKELARYKAYCEVESKYRIGMSQKRMKEYERELRGKVNFARMVLNDNEGILNMIEDLNTSKEILENYESVDWLDMHYDF